MRVAVTGAFGKLGSAVVALLQENGEDVIAIDRQVPGPAEATMIKADLTDLGQAVGALTGADAVIHLAAIPMPIGFPPEVVYSTNVLSHFNVFQAAIALGIGRVVSASSVSALGFPWQHRWSEPEYVPIDEGHPLVPQDAYGLSKANGEDVAAAFARRGAGTSFSLRFGTILAEDDYSEFIETVRADPGRLANVLWCYTDLIDAAEACTLGLHVDIEGHHPLFITSDDTTSQLPTADLLRKYFPSVPVREHPSNPHWSLLDPSRAASVLGWRPQRHWRDVLGSA